MAATRPENWLHDRDHFFKYCSRDAAKAILTGTTLRWSHPSLFNDPFDAQFDLHPKYDHEVVKAETLDRLWEIIHSDEPVTGGNEFGRLIAEYRPHLRGIIRQEFDKEYSEAIQESFDISEANLAGHQAEIRTIMSNNKMLCLTETESSILMWSHYAENHQGIVIKLACVPELDSAWGAAKAVRYRKSMPLLFDSKFLTDMMVGEASIDTGEMVDRMAYTKAIEWSYEMEWRILIRRGGNMGGYEDLKFHPNELEAIVFGCRTPASDREEVSRIVRSNFPHAKIFCAKKSEKNFELIIEEGDD